MAISYDKLPTRARDRLDRFWTGRHGLLEYVNGSKNHIQVSAQLDGIKHHDITALGFPNDRFDFVICHRVMEHVLDDEAGFRELFRILRPGGLVNFSVPQMPQRATSKEWAVPDASHDGHVRQYGADSTDRMAQAGFAVRCESWLLTRPEGELRAVKAYPMRMFNLEKPLTAV